MKVLWFCNTPSLYDQSGHYFHGGGWIESLERLIKEQRDIELAVAFFHPAQNRELVRDATTYYPIHRPAGRKRPLQQFVRNWRGQLTDAGYDAQFLRIIGDFKPDLIQVFGSEGPFGTIQGNTRLPVVIHLQGLINPSLNTYFPAGHSSLEFLCSRPYFFKNILGNAPSHARRNFSRRASREKDILCNARYVMGRTQWDAMISRLYNPGVRYFHVDEVLRPIFYEPPSVANYVGEKFTIISTLSPVTYKGLDVILRTAKELKAHGSVDFQWRIVGVESRDPLVRHMEKKERIYHRSVSIEFLGTKATDDLVPQLLSADVFVHPSYIDNSPNSICEAQMLGLPVIACDVGGISSLVKHQDTGILVPSNGVHELVYYLHQFSKESGRGKAIGEKARAVARRRHDRKKIVDQLKSAYEQILRDT